MNGIKVEGNGPVGGACEPGAYDDHTAMGGMAACPTGGVYAVPVRYGTPMEVVIGPGLKTGARPPMPANETLPSFDLSRIVGVAFAESMMILDVRTPASHRSFEHLATAGRLCIAPYLGNADRIWADTRLLVEHYEQIAAAGSPESRAWRDFKDLTDWLGATNEELAATIGVGRTTAYTWQREGREPREPTNRRIHQLHAAISALRGRLGREGLEAWLAGGEPTRRKVIMAGDLEQLGADIDAQLFSGTSRPDLSAKRPDRGGLEPIADVQPPRPRRRKPRRVKSA